MYSLCQEGSRQLITTPHKQPPQPPLLPALVLPLHPPHTISPYNPPVLSQKTGSRSTLQLRPQRAVSARPVTKHITQPPLLLLLLVQLLLLPALVLRKLLDSPTPACHRISNYLKKTLDPPTCSLTKNWFPNRLCSSVQKGRLSLASTLSPMKGTLMMLGELGSTCVCSVFYEVVCVDDSDGDRRSNG